MEANSTILIVCNRVPYPLKDGGALAMYSMINGLYKSGLQVYVLAMNTSRHKIAANALPELFSKIAGFEMVEVDTDIRILPTLTNFLFSSKPQHTERFFHKNFQKRLISTIEKIKPQYIQLESIYLQEYVKSIRAHSSSLIIQRLHNIEAELWQRLASETTHFLKRFYLQNLAKRIKKYEQEVWATSDAIIPISESDEQYIINTGCSTKLITIPYGIEIDSTIDYQENREWHAYHIGAMDWQPNIEAMEWMQEQIVPEICRLTPNFTFQFAGRNMPQKMLSYKTDSFYCKGEVADAKKFIADKKILIVPLRSGSGIRVKTLEAMAAKKLVVTTSIGIQGINAVDKKHILLANTPKEFAKAIAWVFQYLEEAEQIAQNGQNLVNTHYNATILTQSYLNFIQKLS